MPETEAPRRRPGGRTARVGAAVHEAVAALLAENPSGRLRIAEVARRAGVHPATIYRRWGSAEALALEVAAARLEIDSPVRATGSLVADLVTYAGRAARSIKGPQGLAFLRATMAVGEAGDTETLRRAEQVLVRRGSHLDEMLAKARERGEPALTSSEVVDGILAPIYLRTIFGIGGIDREYLLQRVEAVIRGAVSRKPGRAQGTQAKGTADAIPPAADRGRQTPASR